MAIRSWIAQIKQHSDANVNMILVGNKCDRHDERMVSYGEGENLAKEFKIKFYETSAVEDLNVEECFLNIANDVVNRVSGTGPKGGAVSGSGDTAKLDEGNVSVSANNKKPASSLGWC